ncbi:hypothetical protein [Massilia sp. LjRoot122]|uniref:hypothetical protein n=1 Tax=Massilia sp. LjRoot122 TaxID=3342257 RepID=UPI003ECCE181
MLFFLDTEYTDPLNIELISLGLVSEDGKHEFYCERTDFDMDLCNGFVQTAVLAHTGQFPDLRADRTELRIRLAAWFATLPRSVTVACDSYTDWELLLDALDGERPGNLAGRYDLRSLINNSTYHQAVCRYHELGGRPWHHALHDARAHRMGWLAWMAARAQGTTRA